MATNIVHSDISGSSYTGYEFDYRKLKATRKFIVHSTLTDLEDILNNGSEGLKKNTGSTHESETDLGPRWVDPDDNTANNTANPIVHPDDNELPLGTVDVASLGENRYLVTANYYVQPGVAGGGGTVPNTCSLRSETVAKRAYQQGSMTNPGPGFVPLNHPTTKPIVPYSYVVTVVQLRIKVPFFAYNNPLSSNQVLGYLGGLNKGPVTIGGIKFNAGQVRFDGISMDEFGSVVSSGSNTYRFKGYHELSARSDGFWEQVPIPSTTSPGIWDLQNFARISVNEDSSAQWSKSNIGLS